MIVLSAGCVREVESHCANQDDPRAYCLQQHQVANCSKCIGEADGCTPNAVSDACLPDDVTSVAEGGSTESTAASATGSSTSVSVTTDAGSDDMASSGSFGDESSGTGDMIPEPECGNGIREPENQENCDGTDLGPAQTCEDVNLGTGRLSCNSAEDPEPCRYNLDGCSADVTKCGDGEIEGIEQCDGTDLADQSCETLASYYIGGNLTCDPVECTFNTSACELCHMQGEACNTNADCCNNSCGLVAKKCNIL